MWRERKYRNNMDNQKMDRRTEVVGRALKQPLSIAVIPWGILAGSYAIDAGSTASTSNVSDSICRLGSTGRRRYVQRALARTIKLLTTLFITSRHFLYSVSTQRQISFTFQQCCVYYLVFGSPTSCLRFVVGSLSKSLIVGTQRVWAAVFI